MPEDGTSKAVDFVPLAKKFTGGASGESIRNFTFVLLEGLGVNLVGIESSLSHPAVNKDIKTAPKNIFFIVSFF